jgi:methylthioribose-1-phosphate isomerase
MRRVVADRLEAGQRDGSFCPAPSPGQKEPSLCPAPAEIITDIKTALLKEAMAIRDEDIAICKAIGEHALSLLKPGMGLLTHCNAGRLATVEYGTATSVMYLGFEKGYGFNIYCDETRPLLQGARLTAFELSAAGLKPTVICDNMASSLMREGKIDAVFTGCDRVAANGDTANKIGTSGVAIIAKHYNVPFYICAPSSTLDMATPDGNGIEIEQRPAEEVTEMWYTERMAPAGVNVYNPAFDVTDASLITAIITEDGIYRPEELRAKYG